ncbi:MAG TPA: YihY/virulence factor BrkB family protein [Mucilaginibacter sp.]|jgi:membrane protein
MKIFSKAYFKHTWKILVATMMAFIDDNGLKLSASLAYYTIFSLAPLLIIIISIAGLVWGHDAATHQLYPRMAGYIGSGAALQIEGVLNKLQVSGKSGTAVTVGVMVLFLGASSIFLEIQDSLNIIWRVKAKPKRGWLKLIQNRFLSFSLIIGLGFLLLVTLLVNFVVTALGNWIERLLPITKLLFKVVNLGISFMVIATLFGIIFKFLPDVKIRWRDVRSGAFFTAVLFTVGQYAINLYIQYAAKSSTYMAVGSILVILVWIYYTSAILYIGAEYTQVYAEAIGSRIQPAEYAVSIKQTEIEREVDELPPQHPEVRKVSD